VSIRYEAPVLSGIWPTIFVLPKPEDANKTMGRLTIELAGLDDRVGLASPAGTINSSNVQIVAGESIECGNVRRLPDVGDANRLECSIPMDELDPDASDAIRSVSVVVSASD